MIMLAAHGSGPGDALRDLAHPGPAPFDYLWFLPATLMLCGLLALLWTPIVRAADSRAAVRLAGLPLAWPLIGLGAGCWLVGMQLYPMLLGRGLTFAGGAIDFDHALANLPWFLAGVLCSLVPALRVSIERFRWSTLLIGLAALAVYAGCDGRPSRPMMAMADLGAGIAALSIVASLFALFAKFAARPSAAVRRWVDASFTIYLLHHPIIVALAIWAAGQSFPPIAEWAAICAVTLALSYGAHRLIRRSGLALFLFNGVPMSRPRRRGLLVTAPRIKPGV